MTLERQEVQVLGVPLCPLVKFLVKPGALAKMKSLAFAGDIPFSFLPDSVL